MSRTEIQAPVSGFGAGNTAGRRKEAGDAILQALQAGRFVAGTTLAGETRTRGTGRICASASVSAASGSTAARSPQAEALSVQPRPLTHDTAQVGEADPPHLWVYGKEQELRPKRYCGGWHLARQIPIGLDHA